MKTVVLRQPCGIDNLHVVERDIRRPGPGEILLRVHASSLNFHDYGVVVGRLPTEDGRIPMSDGAGEVVEVGEGVKSLAVGARVVSTFFPEWDDGQARPELMGSVPGDYVDGYASEYVTKPASSFTAIPTDYSYAQAATLPVAALTAWRAIVVNGRAKSGDVVLVQGSGGVSLFALQFAKAAGATVIATSSSDAKLEQLKAMGANHLINYREQKDWGRVAFELCGGVDLVVEVGGAGTLDQSVIACRNGGHIAMIGVLSGHAAPVATAQIMRKQVTVRGITVGSKQQQRDMIRAIDATGIRPVIDSTFPLERLADAFRYQESNRHFGKISVAI